MKPILISIFLFISVGCSAQIKVFKTTVGKCPLDTIEGVIYYQGTVSTQSEPTYGYFISYCGGYQIGHFWGMEEVPTFIPAYFIRNDELVNNKRLINNYRKQKNDGRFTDLKFKTIPFEAVYGMIVDEQKNYYRNYLLLNKKGVPDSLNKFYKLLNRK